MSDTATQAATVEAPVSELVAFKRQVWTVALEKKDELGWCVPGFNEAMDLVGLPHFPEEEKPVAPYRPYEPSAGPRRIKRQARDRNGLLDCGDPRCDLCYVQPAPGTPVEYDETEEQYEARVASVKAQYERELADYEVAKAAYERRLAEWQAQHSAEALITE